MYYVYVKTQNILNFSKTNRYKITLQNDEVVKCRSAFIRMMNEWLLFRS